jgi:hypothetical protein
MSRSGVQRRIDAGRLHRLHRGVYAVGHANVSLDGKRLAALLAAGPNAALSHASAAVIWGIRRGPEPRIEVTTQDRGRKAPTGTRLHRTRTPLDAVVEPETGLRVTTVARTLLDLADVLSQQALTRAVHETERLRLLDLREVERVLAHGNGRRARRKVETALAETDPGPTRSPLEAQFADLIATSDLPPPRRNVHIEAHGTLIEVDNLWPEQRVVVELDGAAAHHTMRAFHADRARDLALVTEGYVVVRLTWRQVTRDGARTIADLRRVLSAART